MKTAILILLLIATGASAQLATDTSSYNVTEINATDRQPTNESIGNNTTATIPTIQITTSTIAATSTTSTIPTTSTTETATKPALISPTTPICGNEIMETNEECDISTASCGPGKWRCTDNCTCEKTPDETTTTVPKTSNVKIIPEENDFVFIAEGAILATIIIFAILLLLGKE